MLPQETLGIEASPLSKKDEVVKTEALMPSNDKESLIERYSAN